MAIVHRDAEITPTKPELLATWLSSQPWFAGDASALQQVGAYRFDDPGRRGRHGDASRTRQ
jgi:hypothetical protein